MLYSEFLFPHLVQVLLLFVEFSVDLGSGLRWGKPTISLGTEHEQRPVLNLLVCTQARLGHVNDELGRAMAQAVSRRLPTAEARVRSQVSQCGICGGQSGTGTVFSPSTSFFPCQFHSTGAPLLGKEQKIIIIFIIGLHNKP
jgi:hypothetical protein